MSALDLTAQNANKRQRELITPEGITLPIARASRGARFIALIIDYFIIFLAIILLIVVMAYLGASFDQLDDVPQPIQEFLFIVMVLVFFILWNGYFIFFEMGPRGATWGKRALKIRVASRDGGQLTPEAVVARNLLRQIEIFMPLSFLNSVGESGAGGWAAAAWFLIFMLFPFFNKDALRAGDLIAGTWVLETPRTALADAMSVDDDSIASNARFEFGEAELAIYGEHELKTLEDVLRRGDQQAMETVQAAICRKIGWDNGAGYEREFLESFYRALRAKLEGEMRFGKRKLSKHDEG